MISQRNDRIRAKGRSFPFEDLIAQTDNANEYQGVSEKLTISNHDSPPFPGDRAPVMAAHHLTFVAVYASVSDRKDAARSLYRKAVYFVKSH